MMHALRRRVLYTWLILGLTAGLGRAEISLPEADLPTAPSLRTVAPNPPEAGPPMERPMAPLTEALRPTLTQPARLTPEAEMRLRLPPEGVAGLEISLGVMKPTTWEAEAVVPRGQRKPRSEGFVSRITKNVEAGWKTAFFVLLGLVLVVGLIARSWYQRLTWREREFEPI
jgi:hypothetical protein